MKHEWDDDGLERFLKDHRPFPPSPPKDEYRRVMAAINADPRHVASRRQWKVFEPLAWIAAVAVIGLALTFGRPVPDIKGESSETLAGGVEYFQAPPSSHARAAALEDFIVETVSATYSIQHEGEAEPFNYLDGFSPDSAGR